MEPTAHPRILRVTTAVSGRIQRPILEIVRDLRTAADTGDDRAVREALLRSNIYQERPARGHPRLTSMEEVG